MNVIIRTTFEYSPKAEMVALRIRTLADPALDIFRNAAELVVDSILTHGSQAVVLCKTVDPKHGETQYAVVYDFTTASCRTVLDIRIYERVAPRR